MTLIEAIEQVLKKAKRPLTVAEIAHRVVSSGRWVTQGATPAASVGSKFYMKTKESAK